MLIDKLQFSTAIDRRQFTKDLGGMGRDVEAAYAGFGKNLGSMAIPAPKLDLSAYEKFADSSATAGFDGGAVAAQIDRVRVAIGGIGEDVRAAFGSAVGPVSRFANDFARKFDNLGPVLRLLAIRIDDAMRFPEFVRRVEALQGFVSSRIGGAAAAGKRAFEKGAAGLDVAAAYGLDAAAPKLETWASKLGASIGKRLKAGVSYGLESATHVAPSMATAFIGARNRGAGGKFSKGMQAAPPKAAPTVRPAVDASLYSRGYTVMRGVYDSFVWANVKGEKLLAMARAADAADINRLIGAYLGFKKAANVVSSFGSVAKATWGTFAKVAVPKISFDPKQSVILAGIGSAARGVGSAFGAMLGPLAPFLSIAAGLSAIGGFFAKGIKGATGLGETVSKTDAVLGDASAGVKSFADEYASKFGLMKQDTLDLAAGFGGLGKGLGGLAGPELEKATVGFTKLAADLSSFKNISLEEAGSALRIGLSGEQSDVLKQLGVVINDTTVKAYGLAHGYGDALSEADKFAIRGKLMFAGLADAQGDLQRTSGSTANSFRGLTGRLGNLAVEAGTALQPAVDKVLALGNTVVGALGTAFGAVKPYFDEFVGYAGQAFDMVSAAVKNPAAAFEVLKLSATQTMTNVGEIFAAAGTNIVQVFDWAMTNWKELLFDAFNFANVGITNLFKNLNQTGRAIGDRVGSWWAGGKAVEEFNWTPMLKGFEATAAKMPEMIRPALTDLGAEIAAAGAPIWADFSNAQMKGAAEGFSAAKGDALAGLDKSPAEKEAKGKQEKEFAGAAEVGSGDAYSSLIRGLYGLKPGADANGKKMVSLLEQINVKLGQQNQMAKRPDPRPVVRANGAQS